jgi:hypothetical protein
VTEPTDPCTHSFPVTPPHSLDHPGQCRHCGITYQQARQEAQR